MKNISQNDNILTGSHEFENLQFQNSLRELQKTVMSLAWDLAELKFQNDFHNISQKILAQSLEQNEILLKAGIVAGLSEASVNMIIKQPTGVFSKSEAVELLSVFNILKKWRDEAKDKGEL